MTRKKQDDKDLYAQDVALALESTISLVQNLLLDAREHAELYGYLKNELEALSEKINEVEKILKGSSGNESLMTRLALLEKDVQNVLKELDENETEEENRRKNISRSQTEKYKVWVTAIFGLISTILGIIASLWYNS